MNYPFWTALIAWFLVFFTSVRWYVPIPMMNISIFIFPIPWGCILTTFFALVVWRVSFTQIQANIVHGYLFVLEFCAILLAYALLFDVAKKSPLIQKLANLFSLYSVDKRIQALVVCFAFGILMQGLWGFVFSHALCALVLIRMGFAKEPATLMGLMGPIVGYPFATMGMPINRGVREGLSEPHLLSELSQLGLSLDDYLHLVSEQCGLVQGAVALIMPTLMMMFLSKDYGRKQSSKDVLAILPFSISIGILASVILWGTAKFVGPDFVNLTTGIILLLVTPLLLKIKGLTPSENFNFCDKTQLTYEDKSKLPQDISLPKVQKFFVILPLIIPLLFLLITRINILDSGQFLLHQAWSISHLMGTPISIYWPFFYYPALAVGITAIVLMFYYKKPLSLPFISQMPLYFLSIRTPFSSMMASMFIFSGINASGLMSMSATAGLNLARLPLSEYLAPFICPWVATVSGNYSGNPILTNFHLSLFQFYYGLKAGGTSALFIALSASAAPMGVILLSSFLNDFFRGSGFPDGTGDGFKKNMRIVITYVTLIGVIGLILLQLTKFS